jgi:NADH-quinone oxidoreductase subunit G
VVNDPQKVSIDVQKLLLGLKPDAQTQMIAKALSEPNAVIITGATCENHPDAALIRTLVALLAQYSGAKVLRFTAGANSAGAWMAGMIPHRTVAGKLVHTPGLDVQSALEAKLKGYFVMGAEPGFDFANPNRARQSMLGAEFVVVLSAFQNESIQEYADVILPMAPYAETSGTYINVDHTWQSFKGGLAPHEESRPAWKILRVLANMRDCEGFEYASSEEVLHEIREQADMSHDIKTAFFFTESLPVNNDVLVRMGEWPLYRCDAIVRHAVALQECAASDTACIYIHPSTAMRLQLEDTATVSQGDIEITLPLIQDERMAPDVVGVANALLETVDLGHAFASITIKP